MNEAKTSTLAIRATAAINAVALCALAGVCIAATPITPYILEDNEHIIVVGTEFHELSVTESADGQTIFINGIPVIEPSVQSHVSHADGDSFEAAKLREAPFVKRLVAGGMTADDAVAACLSRVAEFHRIMADGVSAAKSDPDKREVWDVAVSNWIADPANSGIVDQIKKTASGYEYLLWNEKGWKIVSTSFILDSPPVTRPTAATVASQYIAFFQKSDGEQLLVVGKGGASVSLTGSQRVNPALDQILRVRTSEDYVSGPFTRRQLAVFGIMQGEQR